MARMWGIASPDKSAAPAAFSLVWLTRRQKWPWMRTAATAMGEPPLWGSHGITPGTEILGAGCLSRRSPHSTRKRPALSDVRYSPYLRRHSAETRAALPAHRRPAMRYCASGCDRAGLRDSPGPCSPFASSPHPARLLESHLGHGQQRLTRGRTGQASPQAVKMSY